MIYARISCRGSFKATARRFVAAGDLLRAGAPCPTLGRDGGADARGGGHLDGWVGRQA